ncbi:MAG: cyclase family protein [Candidatus Omnitrophota bacterium]|nr:cyclase family protein [Candidatus Omnitrophota bacterium]
MEIKKLVLLSHAINEQTPLYAGKKGIILKKIKSITKGDSSNAMHWSFPNHIGTHIDVPLHFMAKGLSVTDFKPKSWLFQKISLIEIKNIKPDCLIGSESVGKLRDSDLILIKTGFEKYRNNKIYWKKSPALDSELAGFLKYKCPSLRAVGIDSISISNLNNRLMGRISHKAFLSRNILLIEDMKLSALKKKIPDLIIISPLLIENSDASPCNILGIYN